MRVMHFGPLWRGYRPELRQARRLGRLAFRMMLPFAVFLLVALPNAGPALADVPSQTGPLEPLGRSLASSSAASRQGLGPNATVPSWAAGKAIHFFASPSAAQVPSGGLVESNLAELGRRCETGYCPEPPLLYHEGKGVQHTPAVDMIFWGSNWNKEPGSALRTQLEGMYKGLSGSAWQGILTQYFDSTGRVSSTNTVTAYTDTGVAAPSEVNDQGLREEVASAVKAKSWSREFSSQFVVIPAPGATYTKEVSFTANTTANSPTLTSVSSFASIVVGEGITGPGIPNPPLHVTVTAINAAAKTVTLSTNATATATGVTLKTEGFDHGFCGYHGDDSSGSSYTFVPYIGEEPFKKGCVGFDPKENADHVTSMVASHEYAESATDPQVEPEFEKHGEWYTSNDYEIADICASGDSELPNGTWVQGLWDDHQRGELEGGKQKEGCSLSDEKPPHVYAVTEPASSVTRHSATLNGTVNPEGLETHYHIEYGTTTAYGTSTPEVILAAGTSNQHAAQNITGLLLETTYHYRVVATNSSGTTDGEDRSFTPTRWAIQTTPNETTKSENVLYDVACMSSSACTAVGRYYSETAKETEPLAESWNGTEWSIQLPPIPTGAKGVTLLGSACPEATSCTAVGYYVSGSNDTPFAEHWNGTKWSIQTVPNPSPVSWAYLYGVSCTSSTACSAVGAYRTGSGGNEGGWAARWNGSEWSLQTTPNPEGSSFSELRRVSCASSTECIAVGDYVKEGGYRALVEMWNGTKWSAQLPPNPTGTKESFLDGVSCSASNACTAVGHYIGTGQYMPLAERWNGTEWILQTAATLEHFSVFLTGVSCPSTSECVAIGVYSTGGINGYLTVAEKWNGTAWSVEASPTPTGASEDYLYGVSCLSAACTAVGNYTSTTRQATLAEVRVVGPYVETKPATSVGATEVTLNGIVNPEGAETKYYFEYGKTTSYGTKSPEASAGSGTNSLEESKKITGLEPSTLYHYRIVATSSMGTTYGADSTVTPGWTLQLTPNPEGAKETGLDGTSCTSSTNCEATGAYESSTGVVLTLAEHWIGSKWEIQTTPNPEGAKGSYLEGVSCTSSTSCEAVGTYYNSSGRLVTLAERWNGTKWEIQTTPNPEGSQFNELTHVSCVSSTLCEASGIALNSSTHYVPLAEIWNGTKWEIQAIPNPEGAEKAIAENISCASSSACEVVGYDEGGGHGHWAFAETWNGSEWKVQSSPKPEGATQATLSSVSCTSATSCEAGGNYDNSAGVYVTLAENWNGSEWKVQSTPNPEGAKHSVFAGGMSCSSGTACWAVGDYQNSAGVYVTLAESWNGTKWAVQSTPNPEGAKESYLRGISCTSSTICEATGEYKNSSGVNVTLAEGY